MVIQISATHFLIISGDGSHYILPLFYASNVCLSSISVFVLFLYLVVALVICYHHQIAHAQDHISPGNEQWFNHSTGLFSAEEFSMVYIEDLTLVVISYKIY